VKHTLFTLIFSALLIPISSQAAPTEEQLVGTWYATKHTDDGETMKWLVKRLEDRGYAAISMICSGDSLSWIQKETGTWKLEDGFLLNMPQTHEDFGGKKQVEPGTVIAYSELTLVSDRLTYKNRGQSLLSFKSVSDGFKVSCSDDHQLQ
jgi:plasmid rolling circle replication initiator protein Rep